jgi:hypothetical protein
MKLQEYQSRSSPGKKYTITQSEKNGEIYCDCWVWKKTRTCRHLEHYLHTHTVPKGQTQAPAFQTIEEDYLVVAINKAIEELK